LGQFVIPFDLNNPRAIYSPPAKSHTRIHSPFTVEEQRREGHHSGEESVEIVDLGFPIRRGNLARKTTSEFQELGARSR
jgi:hypothetical protein